ncbi:unnamed protein product, partial [Meganyctiphanes norvegica]
MLRRRRTNQNRASSFRSDGECARMALRTTSVYQSVRTQRAAAISDFTFKILISLNTNDSSQQCEHGKGFSTECIIQCVTQLNDSPNSLLHRELQNGLSSDYSATHYVFSDDLVDLLQLITLSAQRLPVKFEFFFINRNNLSITTLLLRPSGTLDQGEVMYISYESWPGCQRGVAYSVICLNNTFHAHLWIVFSLQQYLYPASSHYTYHASIIWSFIFILKYHDYETKKKLLSWVTQLAYNNIRRLYTFGGKNELIRFFPQNVLYYRAGDLKTKKNIILANFGLPDGETWDQLLVQQYQIIEYCITILRKVYEHITLTHISIFIDCVSIRSLGMGRFVMIIINIGAIGAQRTKRYERHCSSILMEDIGNCWPYGPAASGQQVEEDLHSDSEIEDSIEEQVQDNSTEEELESSVQVDEDDADVT